MSSYQRGLSSIFGRLYPGAPLITGNQLGPREPMMPRIWRAQVDETLALIYRPGGCLALTESSSRQPSRLCARAPLANGNFSLGTPKSNERNRRLACRQAGGGLRQAFVWLARWVAPRCRAIVLGTPIKRLLSHVGVAPKSNWCARNFPPRATPAHNISPSVRAPGIRPT